MRILLIEDDERIARFIERGLKAEGHQIHRLKDGQCSGLIPSDT